MTKIFPFCLFLLLLLCGCESPSPKRSNTYHIGDVIRFNTNNTYSLIYDVDYHSINGVWVYNLITPEGKFKWTMEVEVLDKEIEKGTIEVLGYFDWINYRYFRLWKNADGKVIKEYIQDKEKEK